MSENDSYRKKFPKGKDWKESDGLNHGVEVIAVDIKKYNQLKAKADKLERDLEYSRGCNEVKDKYWDKIRVERNSFLLEKEMLERQVKELETKLYFCNRNRILEDIVGSEDTISKEE